MLPSGPVLHPLFLLLLGLEEVVPRFDYMLCNGVVWSDCCYLDLVVVMHLYGISHIDCLCLTGLYASDVMGALPQESPK